MVALRQPEPRQLYLLPPPPVPSDARVRRLDASLKRMLYGDALQFGPYTLERQKVERSYVEWILYYQDRAIGVVEVRARAWHLRDAVRLKLARILMTDYEWEAAGLRDVPFGAITPPGADFARLRRLIGKGDCDGG